MTFEEFQDIALAYTAAKRDYQVGLRDGERVKSLIDKERTLSFWGDKLQSAKLTYNTERGRPWHAVIVP